MVELHGGSDWGTRVLVLGAPGAGKSFTARAISRRRGLPVVDLDAVRLRHRTDDAAFGRLVRDVVAQPAWVVDGVYLDDVGQLLLARADSIVWLDPPALVCLLRLLRRELGNGRARVAPWRGWVRHVAWMVRKGGRSVRDHHSLRRRLPPLLAARALAGVAVSRTRTPSGVAGPVRPTRTPRSGRA